MWQDKVKELLENPKIPEYLKQEVITLIYCTSCNITELEAINKLRELHILDKNGELSSKYN